MVTDAAGREYRPVAGDLALDLLNTRGDTPDGEVLTDPDQLVAWARSMGLSTAPGSWDPGIAGRRDPTRVYRQVLGLREHLHDVFGAIAARLPPPAPALAGLRDAGSAALSRGRLVPHDGGYAWSWEREGGIQRALDEPAHAALELLTGGPLDRLKRCGGCSYLFLDLSRNRSRRWCSMEDCGTAEKSRRFVTRRAATRRSARSSASTDQDG